MAVQETDGRQTAMRIDMNSDMGESFGRWTLGDDEALLDVVSSANVACGFHAGDPSVMPCGGHDFQNSRKTVCDVTCQP